MTRPDALDAPLWLALAWGAVAAFAAALALLLALGQWAELRVAACFFVPFLAIMLSPHGLPHALAAAIAGSFLVSAAGWALDWYKALWWFDVLTHGLNPLVIVAASMVMFWKADLLPPLGPLGWVAWGTACGTALGLAWEGIELTYLDLTWPDTLLDVVMDAAGSALGGWAAHGIARRRTPEGRRAPATLATVPVRVRR